MVAKIGLNAAGIGVCLNAIRSRTCGEGLPIHVALRKILESPDLPSALAVATHDRVCSPAHFLLASADGEAMGLEVQPGEPGRIAPRQGAVSHTNHLYAAEVACPVQDFPRPDSRPRLARLDALLAEHTRCRNRSKRRPCSRSSAITTTPRWRSAGTSTPTSPPRSAWKPCSAW